MPSKTTMVKNALPDDYARGGSRERAIRDGSESRLHTLTFDEGSIVEGMAAMDNEDGYLWLWITDRLTFPTIASLSSFLTRNRIRRITVDNSGLILTIYDGFDTVESITENETTGQLIACLSGGSSGNLHPDV